MCRRSAAATKAAEMTPAPRGRYVYAIVGGSAAPPRARGIGGRSLVRVRAGRVAAIAEPMDRPPAVAVERLQAQEQLVRRLAARHAAILPARFGSHTKDERELQSILRMRAASFARGLTRVRGAEQMILRLFFSEPPAAVAGVRARARPGTAYLRRRSGADIPALQAIRRALGRSKIVRDERLEMQAESLTVFHLIRQGTSRLYTTAVFEAVSRESGVAAIVSGPWPPYAFTPEVME
jgi:Gas vesicle synthesis protein GvpL/GvpF